MNTDNQVCGSELAIKLSELGYKQDIFNASVLMDLLPAFIQHGKEPFDCFWLHIQKRTAMNILYVGNYLCDSFTQDQMLNNPFTGNLFDHNVYDENFCNMLAKLLIKIKELKGSK